MANPSFFRSQRHCIKIVVIQLCKNGLAKTSTKLKSGKMVNYTYVSPHLCRGRSAPTPSTSRDLLQVLTSMPMEEMEVVQVQVGQPQGRLNQPSRWLHLPLKIYE